MPARSPPGRPPPGAGAGAASAAPASSSGSCRPPPARREYRGRSPPAPPPCWGTSPAHIWRGGAQPGRNPRPGSCSMVMMSGLKAARRSITPPKAAGLKLAGMPLKCTVASTSTCDFGPAISRSSFVKSTCACAASGAAASALPHYLVPFAHIAPLRFVNRSGDSRKTRALPPRRSDSLQDRGNRLQNWHNFQNFCNQFKDARRKRT